MDNLTATDIEQWENDQFQYMDNLDQFLSTSNKHPYFEIDVTVNNTFCITADKLHIDVLYLIKRILASAQYDNYQYRDIVKNAHPFLQGYEENHGWILVEFWTDNAEAISAFVDFVNDEIARKL